MMRCLIPVHQELYPENSLKRAEKLCDEVILLYIVDKKLIEKVQSEASYILPSFALQNVEEFILNIHRQEAEKVKNSIRNIPVELRFVKGEYYESIEKEILRHTPDILMTDSYLRGLVNLNVPVWIDRGGKIEECTMMVQSLRRIGKLKHAIEFAKNVCNRLGASFYIHYTHATEREVLEPLGRLVENPRGELLVFLKGELHKSPDDKSLLLI